MCSESSGSCCHVLLGVTTWRIRESSHWKTFIAVHYFLLTPGHKVSLLPTKGGFERWEKDVECLGQLDSLCEITTYKQPKRDFLWRERYQVPVKQSRVGLWVKKDVGGLLTLSCSNHWASTTEQEQRHRASNDSSCTLIAFWYSWSLQTALRFACVPYKLCKDHTVFENI